MTEVTSRTSRTTAAIRTARKPFLLCRSALAETIPWWRPYVLAFPLPDRAITYVESPGLTIAAEIMTGLEEEHEQ